MPLTHVNFQNSKEFIVWFMALFANCGDKFMVVMEESWI